MRRNRNVSAVNSEAAVTAGIFLVPLHIAGQGRANIYNRAKGIKSLCFLFYCGKGFIGCGVMIALGIEFVDMHIFTSILLVKIADISV